MNSCVCCYRHPTVTIPQCNCLTSNRGNQRYIAQKRKGERDNNSRTHVITEIVVGCYVSRLDMWRLTQRLTRSTNIVLHLANTMSNGCIFVAHTVLQAASRLVERQSGASYRKHGLHEYIDSNMWISVASLMPSLKLICNNNCKAILVWAYSI